MQVSMVELNKHANSIINQAYFSGETVTVFKHGKAIAKILPIDDKSVVNDALSYLSKIKPINVQDSVETVIKEGRQRGF